jgi:hypothetical protein
MNLLLLSLLLHKFCGIMQLSDFKMTVFNLSMVDSVLIDGLSTTDGCIVVCIYFF